MKNTILMNMSIDEIENIVEETLKDYIKEDKYNHLLTAMSVLHNYSTRNLLLILTQDENVSMLNSKGTWEYKGRTIKDDAVGIKIVRPLFETNIETKLESLTGYTMSIVYDIAETNGADIKKIEYNSEVLYNNKNEIINELLKLTDNFSVIYSNNMDDIEDSFVDFAEKKIIVKQGMSVETTLKNIIWQIANIRIADKQEKSYAITSYKYERIKEVEAQSIAFIVCKRMGIDCEKVELHFANIPEEELSRFKYNLDSIRAVSFNIIAKLDKVVERNVKELNECEVAN